MSGSNYSVLLLGGETKLALPVIRSLGQVPGTTIRLAAQHKTPTCYSHYLRSFHKISHNNDSIRLGNLIKIIRQTEAEILLPIDEPATRFVIRHRSELQNIIALSPLSDLDIFEQVIHKDRLNAWLKQDGFPYAEFQVLSGGYESIDFDRLPFPLLLKPVWDRGGDAEGKNVHLFRDHSELEQFLTESKPEAGAYIIQEFIPGYDIDCSLLAKDGRLLAYTIQKGFILGDLQYSPGIELLDEPNLHAQLQAMIAALNWSGIAHLDFRFDERDGTYKLVDFNARYWTTLLGSVVAGVNFPHLACRTALGESYPLPGYQKIHFVLAKAALTNLLNPKQRKMYSFNNTGLYFSLKDPIPEILKAGSAAGRLITNPFKKSAADTSPSELQVSAGNKVA